MKIAAYLFLLLFLAHSGFSQLAITDSVNPLFKGELNGDRIRTSYDNFEPAFPTGKVVQGSYNQVTMSMFHSKSLYVRTALNQKEKLKALEPFRRQLPAGPGYATMGNDPADNAVALFDSMPIIVTAYGINEKNRSMYRFRVVENEHQELVPWQQPELFSPVMMYFRYNSDGTEQKQMAYLGEFRAPVDNSLTIEVKNLMRPDTVYKISAVWIRRAPSVIGTFNPGTLRHLIEVYKFQWKYDQFQSSQVAYYGDITLKPVNENDSCGWQANEFDPNIISLQKLISPDKIVRCESSNAYTIFYFKDRQKLTVSRPIYEYEELLTDYGFIRCHQSHLVNKKYIKSWRKEDGGSLILEDGSGIPVSRSKKDIVYETLISAKK